MSKTTARKIPGVFERESSRVDHPTDQTVREMLADALRAPTGDNSQPWSFQWTGSRLRVLHSQSLARHSLNRNNHASMIALGALLEALRLSATKHGLATAVDFRFQTQKENGVWAEVRFIPTGIVEDPLAAMISKRATDRRIYQGGFINARLKGEILAAQAEFEGCRVHFQARPSSAFIDYFLKSEGLLWRNANIVRDLARWLRLSRREVAASSDGMSWKNVGISGAEAWAFRLIRRFPGLPRILWYLGFGLKIRARERKAIESSAALLCFTARATDPESFCNIGALAYRSWLLLNAHGYGVQPLSFSSSSIADLMSGAMTGEECDKTGAHFRAGHKVFQENFPLHGDEIPIWMFRTGLSPEVPPESRTPRRAL